MKSGQLVLVAAAGLAVAGAVVMRQSNSNTDAASSAQIVQMEEGAAEDTAAKTSVQQQPKPEIYFLNEAGTAAPDKRPRANNLAKVNGNRTVRNTRAITSREEGDFMAPVWSPDGLEVMFTKPGFTGLYTKGIFGGDITQITGKTNVGFDAKWNEDGKIVTRTNDGDVQEFNPDGTPAGSVSPVDDKSVTGPFSSNDTVFYRENPGEAPIPISAGEDRYYGGIVSPDGKYIAYNGLETGIYVKPLDGSQPPVNIGYGTNPSFLPDSSGIVYNVTHDDGHNLVAGDLYLSTLDGSIVSDLTNGSPAIETKPTVSPDGNKIAYESDGVIFVGEIN